MSHFALLNQQFLLLYRYTFVVHLLNISYHHQQVSIFVSGHCHGLYYFLTGIVWHLKLIVHLLNLCQFQKLHQYEVLWHLSYFVLLSFYFEQLFYLNLQFVFLLMVLN